MQREAAKENFRNAEYLESILERHCISILPALVFRGQKMQEINGQFFYVFKWYDVKSLKDNKIKISLCRSRKGPCRNS